MKTLFRGTWNHAARMAVAAVLVCVSQVAWAEDKLADAGTPASDGETFVPREDAGPVTATIAPALEPRYRIPSNLNDPVYKQFVDLNLLGDAYLNNDAALMVDVGLQLMEGERVLARSLRGLTAKEVLDVGLRMATEQRDTVTLDRLSKVAEKLGDKDFSGKLEISRQLASQSRAAAPALPEVSDKLTYDDVFTLQQRVVRLDRARAVGDLQALQTLQAELEACTLDAAEIKEYLKSEVSKQIATLSPAEANPDPVVAMLGELSGVSRGDSQDTLSQDLISKNRVGVYRNARPYRLNSANSKIWVDFANNQGEWRSKNSLEGLRARYGSVYVNPGSYMEIVVDANGVPIPDGKYETTRTRPGKQIVISAQNPNDVKVFERNPVKGGWWPTGSITFEEAMLLRLETTDGKAGPAKFGATPIVFVNRELQPPERVIACSGNQFTWQDFVTQGSSATTIQQIVGAGGQNVKIPPLGPKNAALYAKALAMPGGAIAANIVAAGGGNFNIANIVAAGGGNIVAAGGGNIVEAGGGNLTSRFAMAAIQSLIQDGGAYLIGKGGAGLIGQDGASFSAFIGVGVGSLSGAIKVNTLYKLTSTSPNPFSKNAVRID